MPQIRTINHLYFKADCSDLILPRVNLAAELDAGRLVPILEDYWDKERNTWIVYPHRRHLPLRVKKAIDFLLDALATAPDKKHSRGC